jgi:hypothetical protein
MKFYPPISPEVTVTGVATEATMLAIKSILESQKDYEESFFIDQGNSDTLYIRAVGFDEVTGTPTFSYYLPDGTPYTVIGPSVLANKSDDYEIIRNQYRAIANGTGYSIGDVVAMLQFYEMPGPVPIGTIFYNETTQAFITPVGADLSPFEGTVYVTNAFNLESTQDLVRIAAQAIVLVDGTQADSAVTGDSAGTISAKLRGILVELGTLTETAPATDTASSGINGRLQRIAQRLSSLIALLPASIGQKANTTSLGVSLSTEQEAILSAIRNALEIIDDWDDSDRAKVNLIAGQAAIDGGAGAVSAKTVRTHLSNEALAALGLIGIKGVDGSTIVSNINPFPISDAGGSITVDGALTVNPSGGSLTDGSGTITTGGTRQQIFAANATRKYLLIQNNSSASLWVNFGVNAAASQPSILIFPGQSYENPSHFCPTDRVDIFGAVTGQTFTAKQF